MDQPQVFLVSLIKALVDIALWSLIGQAAVGLIAGARRQQNPVYQLLGIIAGPAVKFVRLLMPKLILDRHVPIIAFFLLFWVSIILALVKRQLAG